MILQKNYLSVPFASYQIKSSSELNRKSKNTLEVSFTGNDESLYRILKEGTEQIENIYKKESRDEAGHKIPDIVRKLDNDIKSFFGNLEKKEITPEEMDIEINKINQALVELEKRERVCHIHQIQTVEPQKIYEGIVSICSQFETLSAKVTKYKRKLASRSRSFTC